MNKIIILTGVLVFILSCRGGEQKNTMNQTTGNMIKDSTKLYGYNLDFLRKHIEVIELRKGNSSVAVVPAWQGRVMTSTTEGYTGYSFGWINHDLISSGKILPHINAYGGEERLWLGPEGGQFAIFFKKGEDFIYDNWQTPAFIDTEPFKITLKTDTSVNFSQSAEIENYSGSVFKLRIERNVTLLTDDQLVKLTGLKSEGLNCVAYLSENKLVNEGNREWTKETGLLSVWMLGMFNPSPSVVVVIPVKPGDEKDLGVAVNDSYFGKIPTDRLRIIDNRIYFRADGKSRGKIGISQQRATGVLGSYDSENKALTFLFCKLPDTRSDYVNSAWELQKYPYSGDAFNSYNDGPLADGSQMGPFYELETSSPAAALKPGAGLKHDQITVHLTGDRSLLDKVTREILGVTLDQVENAFK